MSSTTLGIGAPAYIKRYFHPSSPDCRLPSPILESHQSQFRRSSTEFSFNNLS